MMIEKLPLKKEDDGWFCLIEASNVKYVDHRKEWVWNRITLNNQVGEIFATNFLLQIGIELSFVSFTHNLLLM